MRVNNMKQVTFKDLIRQNTGSHMLDSGAIYGYKYNSPIDTEIIIDAEVYKRQDGTTDRYLSATIPLIEHLETNFEIDYKLTKMLRKAKVNTIPECGEYLEKKLGIKYLNNTYDNTYNHDNDLDQNYQSAVLSNEREYWYDDNALWLIETHNGCDIRGGYSDVVVCRKISEAIYDFVVGWRVSKVIKASKEMKSIEDSRTCDKWEIGYSGYPTSLLNKDIKRLVRIKKDKSEIEVELNCGAIVRIYPYINEY